MRNDKLVRDVVSHVMQIYAPEDIMKMATSRVPFKLVYVQDGEVIQIPATYNAETNTIDFESDVFGVFALVYGEN